jgi:cation diffusion facilitator family transporter
MKDRTKIGDLQGIISIIVNTFLFAIKFWASILSRSIAIIADAWHTLSDSLSSLILIIGIRFASKKSDKKHPFGYGRREQITSIFIAFLLGLIAFEFLKDAILRLKDNQSAHYGMLAILVTIISIISKEILAQYAFRVARKTNIIAAKADGWHQ